MNIFWFILGTILGSFYLVVGTRLPKDEDVIKSRSKCDSCQKTLKWYNLIPIFSYIFQKGRCSSCGQKISIDHFLVELITGLLFLFASFYYPKGYDSRTLLLLQKSLSFRHIFSPVLLLFLCLFREVPYPILRLPVLHYLLKPICQYCLKSEQKDIRLLYAH